jgi:hypothetical protein
MTIFTRPRWCIEPLRPHGKGAVSTATALAAPFTYVALASSIGPEGGSGIWAAA